MRPKRLKVRATPLDGHAFGRSNILKVLKDVTGIKPADISQEGEDIVLFFSCEEELEKLLTNDAILRKEHHLHPHFPRQFLAGRTVFTSRTSQWIADRPQHHIKDNIEDENPNLAVFNLEFCNTDKSSMKITFTTIAAATQAATQGFYCFGLKIPPHQIKKERYHEIQQCFKCYELSHPTNKCQHPVQKCSLCALDHHYSICKATVHRCLLCDGNHPAISYRCPRRQERIKAQVEAKRNNPSTSATRAPGVQPTTLALTNRPEDFPVLPTCGSSQQATQPSQWGPKVPQATSQPPASRAGIIPGLIKLAERLAGPDNQRFVSELNALYIANGLAPIITTGVSLTASSTTPETTTRTTMRSTSTPTPEPPMTRATQTEVIPSPAPNTPTITISAAALADVLSTNDNSTTSAPETATTTNQRHLSLPKAARRKTKTPTTEVTDSSDEEIIVGAPPPHHKYDTYTVQDFLMEATSPNSNDSTAQPKSQAKKKRKT